METFPETKMLSTLRHIPWWRVSNFEALTTFAKSVGEKFDRAREFTGIKVQTGGLPFFGGFLVILEPQYCTLAQSPRFKPRSSWLKILSKYRLEDVLLWNRTEGRIESFSSAKRETMLGLTCVTLALQMNDLSHSSCGGVVKKRGEVIVVPAGKNPMI